MVVHWPQIVWLVLAAMGVGIAMSRFGQTKKADTYDFVDILAPFVVGWVLWCGGFFG